MDHADEITNSLITPRWSAQPPASFPPYEFFPYDDIQNATHNPVNAWP